jgi:hypothetical protein
MRPLVLRRTLLERNHGEDPSWTKQTCIPFVTPGWPSRLSWRRFPTGCAFARECQALIQRLRNYESEAPTRSEEKRPHVALSTQGGRSTWAFPDSHCLRMAQRPAWRAGLGTGDTLIDQPASGH